MVIAEMLGVDPCDRDLFKEWSNGIMATVAGDYESLVRNYDHIFDYFRGVIAARRSSPRDDLVTALVRAEVDGHKLTDDDILGFCALLLIAGNETTTNLLGNAATVLAAHRRRPGGDRRRYVVAAQCDRRGAEIRGACPDADADDNDRC